MATEQEKREQKAREQAEVIRKYYAELQDNFGVMTANGWTLAADISALQYSTAELEKFFTNQAPATNTHGVNFDKARYIP